MAIDATSASGLWRNRNWRLMFLGQAISLIGDNIFDVTIVLWIATIIAKGQTWAPLAVGGALIAVAAPVLLVGPFSGVFADRWNRRRTMIAADLIRAALIASLIVLPIIGDRLSVATQLTIVYAAVALSSSVAQFFNGARFGLLAAVVAPPDQPRASGASQTVFAVAAIIGPPLAAPLLFSVGVEWALLANAASFLFSFAMVALMRVRAPEPAATVDTTTSEAGAAAASFRREFGEGARYFVRSPVLMALMISVVVATLGIGAINALDVFFVTDNLHAPASSLGTLGAAFGVGSIVGAVAATVIGNRIRPATVYWTMLALTGAFIVVFARTQSLVTGLVALLLASIPIAMVNTVAGPILLASTPQHLLGRVMSVFNPIQQAAAILGMAVYTWLASTTLRNLDTTVAGVHFGRIDTLYVVSGLLVLAAGLWVGFPLRTIDHNAHAAAGTEAPAVVAAGESGLIEVDAQFTVVSDTTDVPAPRTAADDEVTPDR